MPQLPVDLQLAGKYFMRQFKGSAWKDVRFTIRTVRLILSLNV